MMKADKGTNRQIRILMVCYGNICRSPMAEFVLRDLAEKEGVADRLLIDSAATSSEELGNGVHWGTREKLREHSIRCTQHFARQLVRREYADWDLIVGMEPDNLRAMRRIFGGDPDDRFRLLGDYAGLSHPIADPWYTGNFDATWRDVSLSCRAMLQALREKYHF